MIYSTILGLILLIPINVFSMNVNAEPTYYNNNEYDYENNYDHEKYSYYPTEINKYECKKGAFEGFFVSSVEFCKLELPSGKGNPDPDTDNSNSVLHLLNITKQLFVCNDAQTDPTNFFCFGNSFLINGPNSGNYTQCTDQTCFVNESDFGVQIFKEVEMISSLSPTGNHVNLDNNNYLVTEDRIDKLIDKENECNVAGFDHDKSITKKLSQGIVEYLVCVDYEGDCAGSISEDEERTCNIKNYLVGGLVTPPFENINNSTSLSPLDTQLQIQSSTNNIEGSDSLNEISSVIPDIPF